MPKQLTITSCPQCPHHAVYYNHSDDLLEELFRWNCDLLRDAVRRQVEGNDKTDFIPDRCPLEDVEEKP